MIGPLLTTLWMGAQVAAWAWYPTVGNWSVRQPFLVTAATMLPYMWLCTISSVYLLVHCAKCWRIK